MNTAIKWATPAQSPARNERGTTRMNAKTAAFRTSALGTRPIATGLSTRPLARSRSASRKSLVQPTRSWPHKTAVAMIAVRKGPRPADKARIVTITVTPATASGCEDRRRSQRACALRGIRKYSPHTRKLASDGEPVGALGHREHLGGDRTICAVPDRHGCPHDRGLSV